MAELQNDSDAVKTKNYKTLEQITLQSKIEGQGPHLTEVGETVALTDEEAAEFEGKVELVPDEDEDAGKENAS